MLIWQHVMQMKLKHFCEPEKGSKLLFESCRSVIYSVLKYELHKSKRRIVYVCDFTCEAVKDAIDATGAETRQYILNSSLTCENLGLDENLKNCIFIVQMTFGIPAFSLEFLQDLRSRGAVLIADCSLSSGTKADIYNAAELYCDVSVRSYECSKSLSYGWGGELADNTPTKHYKSYFENQIIKRVNIASDLLRILQIIYSVCFLRNNNQVANLFRKILTVLGIFRRSSGSSKSANLGLRCGRLTERWIMNTEVLTRKHYDKLHKKLRIIHDIVGDYDLLQVYKNIDGIVSPRYPVLIDESRAHSFEKIFSAYEYDIGVWFDYSPYTKMPLRFGESQNLICLNLPLNLADNPIKLRGCLDEYSIIGH